MSTLSIEQQKVILANIHSTASFDRLHFTKPKIQLITSPFEVVATVLKHDLAVLGDPIYLCAEALLNKESALPLIEHKVSVHDINYTIKRMRTFGVMGMTIVVALGEPVPNRANPPHLFIFPDWELFDEKEYTFECRASLM